MDTPTRAARAASATSPLSATSVPQLPTPRAQDAFAALLREHLAPALRRRGLRGSGQTFTLPDETWWLLLGFQRSRYSTSSCVEFTVHAVAVRQDVWARLREQHPRLGARPTPSDTGLAGARRIDQIDPGATTVWWEVHADTPTGEAPAQSAVAELGADVLEAVDATLLPWLRERSGRPGLDGSARATGASGDATDEGVTGASELGPLLV